jgi:hypothetical protein
VWFHGGDIVLSHMDLVARLLELDQQYRLILHSSDHIHDEIFETIHPEMHKTYIETEAAIDDLRALHPDLLRKLEDLYRRAHPDGEMTTGDLIDFAYQQHLFLTGEPYLGEFRAPD